MPFLRWIMPTPVLLGGLRSPLGRFGGRLRHLPATELASRVIAELLARLRIDPREVEELILGNVLGSGLGTNPARQVALRVGLSPRAGAYTINQACGSGMKALLLAAQAIKAGEASLMVAGGMESMSRAPYLDEDGRWGSRLGDRGLKDALLLDGLWEPSKGCHIALTGELVAQRFEISREEADSYALESHRRASRATKEGLFREELVPLSLEDGEVLEVDECIRHDTSLEQLARLKPSFKPDGILTAGNSSQLSDGAAALLISSEEWAEERGLKPLARMAGYKVGGLEPELVMEAPIPTCKALLESKGLNIEEVEVVEHNEAYATASLAVMKGLGIDHERFNPKGGAIALGHPLGCSGARITVTLLHTMLQRGYRRGLATICMGGGNALALLLEKA